jgi:hypothetical protein
MIAILTESKQIVKTISDFDTGSVETGLLQVGVGNEKKRVARQDSRRGAKLFYHEGHEEHEGERNA